jgi:hypothetical protein
MNPKASFGNFIAASAGTLYPPLRGIVQLINPVVLRTELEFHNNLIIILLALAL